MAEDFHEKEEIRLSASESKSPSELHVFLKGRGFTSEDDFFYLDRRDTPESWQAISVISINVYWQGVAVDDTDDDTAEAPRQWDELRVEYLLASLPPAFIDQCVLECEALADRFGLRIQLNGDPMKPGELRSALRDVADGLAEQWYEPGSEALGILIAESYGR